MKRTLTLGLLLALAIEVVNFVLFAPPLADDLPLDAPWGSRALELQWVVMHRIGLLAVTRLDSLGHPGHEIPILFLGGYLTTAALVLAILFLFRSIRRTPSPATQP